jgi:exopolysaccharide biosynthesis polyprenyl glycosylphosphotransferase
MIERLGRRVVTSVLAWDLLITLLTLSLTTEIRVGLDFGNEVTRVQAQIPWQLYGAVAIIWAVVFMLLTPQRALFFGTFIESLGRLLASVTLASLTFAGVLYFSYRDISRLQFLYFAALDLIGLLILHTGIRLWLRMRGHSTKRRRTLIVGSGLEAQQLVREFERRPWVGINVIGYATDDCVEDSVPILGKISDTAEIITNHAIDEVIFVALNAEEVANLSLHLVQEPVMLHMVPSVLDLTFARTPVETFSGIPLISLRESALTYPQRALKRAFDIVGSALLLILFSPVMLLIAIAIKLDSPGPVFFSQERIGEHGRRFRMMKFRSMYQDAEQRWHQFSQRDSAGRLTHKQAWDPRITPIGQKLRRTSLDELPQLFNVLLGEMSLVGPRPEMPYIALGEYEPWQWQRFRVPPGMTGWWQVNGRGERLMHLHTQDDLYYIQNYSFWLDLKILWMTLGAVLRGQGAF